MDYRFAHTYNLFNKIKFETNFETINPFFTTRFSIDLVVIFPGVSEPLVILVAFWQAASFQSSLKFHSTLYPGDKGNFNERELFLPAFIICQQNGLF